MATTFGKETVGGATGWASHTYCRGYKATLIENGDVTNIAFYTSNTNGTWKLKVGIYDDAAGSPNNLVAGPYEKDPAVDGWNEIAVSPAASLTAGTYWLTAQFNDSTNPNPQYYYDTVGGNDLFYNENAYATWEDPMVEDGLQTRAMSIHADYTPSGGGLSIPVAMRHYRNLRTAITKINRVPPSIRRF